MSSVNNMDQLWLDRRENKKETATGQDEVKSYVLNNLDTFLGVAMTRRRQRKSLRKGIGGARRKYHTNTQKIKMKKSQAYKSLQSSAHNGRNT